MKKPYQMICLLLVGVCLLNFSACTDDDWSPYYDKSKVCDIVLERDVFWPDQLKEELQGIADSFEEGTTLGDVNYTIYPDQTGTAVYQFWKPLDDPKALKLELTVDLSSRKVVKEQTIKGHSKHVDAKSYEIPMLGCSLLDKFSNDFSALQEGQVLYISGSPWFCHMQAAKETS